MNGSKRYRRYLVATAAALGLGAILAGPASAVFTPTTIPLPNAFSRPEGIALGNDGAIYYADFAGQIGKTTGGPGTAFGVPNDGPGVGVVDISGPADITRGPVGNDLWFSADNSTVGRVTAAGAIQGYVVDGQAMSVRGITAANGNLWFVGKGTPLDFLRSITPGGVLGLPIDVTALGAPEAITTGVGADANNIYFTTSLGNIVKKNTATGDAPATIATVAGQSDGITVGPDGNLWVTSAPGGGGQVSKISPAGGVLASYPVGAVPKGITTGPDGALWFTQAGSNSVGRVTVTGETSAIPLTGCANPEDIVTGADKALWVTCFGNNALVRIVDTVTGPPGPGTPGPGTGPGTTPIANLKATFKVKKSVLTTKRFTVGVTFNNALTKSRVRVQYRTVKTRGKGVIKTFKTLATKTVTGKKANFSVRIKRAGVYYLRVTYVNGPKTVNGKNLRVIVRKPPARR